MTLDDFKKLKTGDRVVHNLSIDDEYEFERYDEVKNQVFICSDTIIKMTKNYSKDYFLKSFILAVGKIQ